MRAEEPIQAAAPFAVHPTAWASGGLVIPEPWMREGLCAQADPEAFFPEKGGSTRAAKKVCAACTVSAECLEYALEHGERFGIWGGHSERERRRMLRGRAR